MSTLNQATIIGNCGRDPEIKSMQNGSRVANLTIATTESWKNKSGEKQEKTEWHRVTVWNDGLIGVIERYVKKGDKLFVQGKIETRKYTDKDGVERYSTEIVLGPYDSKMLMLGGAKGVSEHGVAKADGYASAQEPSYATTAAQAVSAINEEDIPF